MDVTTPSPPGSGNAPNGRWLLLVLPAAAILFSGFVVFANLYRSLQSAFFSQSDAIWQSLALALQLIWLFLAILLSGEILFRLTREAYQRSLAAAFSIVYTISAVLELWLGYKGVFTSSLGGIYLFAIAFLILRLARQPVTGGLSAARPAPAASLGMGSSAADLVIRRLLGRSQKADSASLWIIIFVIVLVIIGGSASFRLRAESENSQLVSLENEREKLLDLVKSLDAAAADLKDEGVKAKLDEIQKTINARYGRDYSATLHDIRGEIKLAEDISWPEIAIRATIGVLTVFLVQILFSWFKYSRQLGSYLASRAESIELIKGDSDAEAALRQALVSTLSAPLPVFGANPKTIVDQALEIAKRALNSKEKA